MAILAIVIEPRESQVLCVVIVALFIWNHSKNRRRTTQQIIPRNINCSISFQMKSASLTLYENWYFCQLKISLSFRGLYPQNSILKIYIPSSCYYILALRVVIYPSTQKLFALIQQFNPNFIQKLIFLLVDMSANVQ